MKGKKDGMLRVGLSGLCLLAAACAVSAAEDEAVEWLERQDLYEFCLLNEPDPGLRAARAGKNAEGTSLKINGTTYEHGIGLHAFPDKIQIGDFFPGGKGRRFSVTFGLDDRSGDSASAILNLYADGKLAATSGTVRKGEPAKEIAVDLKGVLVLSIELKEGGTRSYRALADLADAAFAMEDGAKLLDSPASFTRQLGVLTPPDDGRPRVNGPALYGVRPKKLLLYRVPVSGDLPLEITVEGLPDGTSFDPVTQWLKGVTPARKGDYPLVIRAKNAKGEMRRDFTLKVGDRIGLTPPMGWNSWNACGPGVSDATVRRMADAALKFRLVDHGWQYLVIDDGWQRSVRHRDNPIFAGPLRDEKGDILPNAKFPDMKALADYVHSKGLKFGLYSSPGKTTCYGAEGSWMNEWRDAERFLAWGVDYLKYDCCEYDAQRFSEGRHHKLIPWMMMGKALQEGDRDIFYSISGGGLVDLFQRCRANSQRITGDCFNSWPHVRRSMTAESYYWMNTEPGRWCDPDMLVVQASGPKRGHRLTPNECYTHVSMWCLFSAPLMMGYALDRTTPETLSMLTNDEVLDVNQDALGLCAAPIQTPGRDQVWAKPMADGSLAVGLVNMAYTEHRVKFCFRKAGMRGKWRVRDLWRQKDEGVFENCYEVSVPGHATQLVRIWPTAGAAFDGDVLDIRDFAWMRVTEEERPVRPDADGCRGCAERREAARSSFEADSDAMAASRARMRYPERVRNLPPLKGVMLGLSGEREFADLKAMGATLVRYQMQADWKTFEKAASANGTDAVAEFWKWLDGRLDHLAEMLPWSRRYGIRICVDQHVHLGGFTDEKYSSDMVFADPKYEDLLVAVWQKIARRFRGNWDAIYGYDLFNEPIDRENAKVKRSWHDVFCRVIDAIRAVDPEATVVVEPNCNASPRGFDVKNPYGLRGVDLLPYDNLIYSVHVYQPMGFTHQGLFQRKEDYKPLPYPSAKAKADPNRVRYAGDLGKDSGRAETWDREFVRREIQSVLDFQRRTGVRILVGEFSAAAYAPGGDEYVRDLCALFREYGWDWTYHAFRESACWSFEHAGPSFYELKKATEKTNRQKILEDALRVQSPVSP